MNRAALVLLTGLGGCLKYEEGMAEQGTLACQLHDACGSLATLGYDTVDECVTDATNQEWIACQDYSEQHMQACVDAWQAAVDGNDCGAEDDPPAVCATVCTGD